MNHNLVDLLIHDASVWTPGGLLVDGAVAVRRGIIDRVGLMRDAHHWPEPSRRLDARGMLLLPGLVNTHTHAAMSVFRGLADDLSLEEWLRKHIFPAEARFVNVETVYWGTLLSCVEMLRTGITTVCDGYFFEDAAAEAAERSGIRAVMGQGIIDFPSPDCSDPSRAPAIVRQFLDRWKDHPRVKPSIFCHASYTCSPETLKKSHALARERNALFQIHLAEGPGEVDQIRRQYGLTPGRHLHGTGVLEPGTLAVHCIHLDEEELDLLASSGAGVSHCPESNMKLASGVAPVPELLRRGVPVGLGTDGPASNNDQDLFGEMRSAALLHKVHRMDPTVMSAPQVLDMAAMGGARALGLGDEIGAIEPGRRADLVLVDMDRPHLTPLYHVPSQMVYAASGADVHTVMVDGEILLENRRFVHLDVDEIMENVRKIKKSVKKSSSSVIGVL
ncbi:MAG: amidohydrolase [Deltaproteobacteria bacterium]|nr:amidohydrolase [Deltaproteobacteria bacterium]MBW2307392.1 amidohydrolase [Deltaproteobacteria bacterium]